MKKKFLCVLIGFSFLLILLLGWKLLFASTQDPLAAVLVDGSFQAPSDTESITWSLETVENYTTTNFFSGDVTYDIQCLTASGNGFSSKLSSTGSSDVILKETAKSYDADSFSYLLRVTAKGEADTPLITTDFSKFVENSGTTQLYSYIAFYFHTGSVTFTYVKRSDQGDENYQLVSCSNRFTLELLSYGWDGSTYLTHTDTITYSASEIDFDAAIENFEKGTTDYHYVTSYTVWGCDGKYKKTTKLFTTKLPQNVK